MKALHIMQILVVASLIGVVGFPIVFSMISGDLQEYVNESAEWCEQRGGDLAMVHSVWHGGLHCDLPNGTSVHMSRVIDDV